MIRVYVTPKGYKKRLVPIETAAKLIDQPLYILIQRLRLTNPLERGKYIIEITPEELAKLD